MQSAASHLDFMCRGQGAGTGFLKGILASSVLSMFGDQCTRPSLEVSLWEGEVPCVQAPPWERGSPPSLATQPPAGVAATVLSVAAPANRWGALFLSLPRVHLPM